MAIESWWISFFVASVLLSSMSPTDIFNSKKLSLDRYLFPGMSGSEFVVKELSCNSTFSFEQKRFWFPSVKESIDIPSTASLTRSSVKYKLLDPSAILSVSIPKFMKLPRVRYWLVIPFPIKSAVTNLSSRRRRDSVRKPLVSVSLISSTVSVFNKSFTIDSHLSLVK